MAGQFPTLPQPVDSLLYFLFNNFYPMHTTEATDTQKPSIRCSFKESSHGQSFDSFSPSDKQACRKSPPALESGGTKTWDSKASCTLEMGLFLSCLFFYFVFSFSILNLCTTCFDHYWDYLSYFLQNAFLGYKCRKHWKIIPLCHLTQFWDLPVFGYLEFELCGVLT